MKKTLDGIFTPRSVAVVGASPNPSRFGGRIVHSLVVNDFPGTIFPVNPKYDEIAGNRCYPSVAAIDDPVDLAILTVSEKQVMPTLEDCAAKGVKLAVLFGAGYAETGEQGELAQAELRELSERTGLRLLGPNCVGYLNVWDRVPATPAGAVDPPRPRKGGISIIAQSGFVGMETIFGRGYDAGYGFRYVITTGNEADLEAGELIAWLAEDEGTEVIVAYLEGIRDPERFREAARLAREAGKPIVILKGGRSPGGERSARSHTAALAVSDSVLDAVCEAEGIVRVTDLDDLWEVAGKLSDGLRLAGPRVAVVGTSGGINTIFADDLRDVGLEMPELSESTVAKLAEILPWYGSTANPVDLTGYFTGAGQQEVYPQLAALIASDPGIDVVVFAVQVDRPAPWGEVIPGLVEQLREAESPVVILSGGASASEEALESLQGTGISVYWSPSRCARGLKLISDYGVRTRAASAGAATNGHKTPAALSERLDNGSARWQTERDLLASYGIATVETRAVASEAEAVETAAALGYPCVMKGLAPGLSHKSDLGLVRIGLADADAVSEAYHELAAALTDKGSSIVVQQMLQGGLELIAGVQNDPTFGPVVMVESLPPRAAECMVVRDFAPGQQLGDFVLEHRIGAGGMGLVFRAHQISLNRPIALKVLPPYLRYSESARTRFQREVEAAARLRHRNIVAVYTTGEDSGTIYYAMELIDGPSLSDVIDELRRYPLPEVRSCQPIAVRGRHSGASTHGRAGDVTPSLEPNAPAAVDLSLLAGGDGYFAAVAKLMTDVAAGLDYAHQMQVVHRDVKPSNLLLSRDGHIHINDFGLARLADEPGLTRTGDVIGTPFYMAPEQISAAAGDIDGRTDIYALGVTIYELLTLRPPFVGENREQVMAQITREEPLPPRAINRLVPRDLDTICLKALEKQSARRYPSAGAFAEDLQRFAAGLPISARRTGVVGHGLKWVGRHRAWAAAVMGICALVALALFFAYRSHVAESRWTDAEFGRIFEKAQLAALEGDLPRAGDAISEAEKLGAPPAQLSLLRGQLDLHSGKFQEACDQLEVAVRDMPDSVAAYALLTNAYGANEQHEKRIQAASHLTGLKPSTLQDYLLLAEAQSYNNFSEAHATLDEAVGRYKTSVVARLTRGGVLVYRSMESADTELAEAAIDDLRIASELLEPNTLLLGRMMQARLVAAAAYESVGDLERRQEHLDQAALTAEELKRFSGQYRAHLWRAVYFDYVGDDEQAVESWLVMKDHTITFLVLTLFRLERFQEAIDLCDERSARYKGARFTDFFRAFILSAMTDSPQKILAAFEPHGKETLDSLNAHRFTYTIYCLAGNLEAAHQYSRNLRKSGVRLAHDEETWRKILDYTCGDLDEDVMLPQISSSRTALCQAHFVIGMTKLATGNREDARKHFLACSNLKINRYVEDFMSRVLVAQLERKPNWPPWIASRQLKREPSGSR